MKTNSDNVLYLGKPSYMKFYVYLEDTGIRMDADNQSFGLRAKDRTSKIKSWDDFREYFLVSTYDIYKLDKEALRLMLAHLNKVLEETIEEFLARELNLQKLKPHHFKWDRNHRHCEIKTLYRIINEGWKGYWLRHEN